VIVALDLLLFVVLVATAVLALRAEDLLTAVVLLAAYSLFAALLFTGMAAVDVGLVEGALGAGLTGVLFIAAILATTNDGTERPVRRRRRVAVVPVIAAFLGLLLYASTGLPDRGDPDAPAQVGVSTAFLEGAVEETQTPNVVTALLADYRSQDTLGETLVILTAALATALVLVRRPDEPHVDVAHEQETSHQDDPEVQPRPSPSAERGDAPEGDR
jgi:multicomponent Na+:H+ antiporter subunit B